MSLPLAVPTGTGKHSRFVAPIVSFRLGVGIAALVVWYALLGAVVGAACAAGNYTASSGACARCTAGYFCAAGAFNQYGSLDGNGAR